MSWRDLRIWMKLMLVFGSCFIIYISITIWNNRSLNSIEREKQVAQNDQIILFGAIGSVNDQFTAFNIEAINYLQNKNDEQLKYSINKFSSFLSSVSKESEFKQDELKKNIDVEVAKIIKTLNFLSANMISNNRTQQDEALYIQNIAGLNKAINEIAINSNQIKTSSFALIEKEQQRIIYKTTQQKKQILFVQLATVLVFSILFLILIFSIENAKKGTVQIAKRMSKGELRIDFGKINKDEFGEINQSLFDLQAKLRIIVEHIHLTLNGVKKASNEFFSSSQLISDGANNQAATSNEISATMDQISIIAQQTTESANETSKIAKRAYDGIQKGAHDVNDAFLTIEEIAHKNSIISEISYQTKILSINASVEAARAAEFGKGFGVIADQVKTLAEDSHNSASDIKSVSLKGVALTRDLAQQLTLLVDEFQKTSDLISEVADSGKEQSDAIEQISQAIQDLNNITQQNASSSEELAASSEQLVNLSDELASLLEFFKLEEIVETPILSDTENPESENDDDEPEADQDLKYTSSFSFRANSTTVDEHNEDYSEFLTDEHSFPNNDETDFDDETTSDVEKESKIKWGNFKWFSAKPKAETNELEDVYNDKNEAKNEDNDESDWLADRTETTETEKNTFKKSSGVRINLADNDDIDSKFKKMK